MLFLGPKGLAAFAILYTLGNIAAFCRQVNVTAVCCELMSKVVNPLVSIVL